jgi:hypothetical protein
MTVQFPPDGSLLVFSTGSDHEVLDPHTGSTRHRLAGPDGQGPVELSGDCRHFFGTRPVTEDSLVRRALTWLGLADASHKPVALFVGDTQTGRILAEVHTGLRWGSASIRVEGKTLITRHEDGAVRFWNLPPARSWSKILGIPGLLVTVLVATRFFAQRWRKAR